MKIKIYKIIVIIIIFMIGLLTGLILLKKDNNVKPVSIGSDNNYIYLIYSDLSSKKIYEIAHYYSSEYILRDNIIYVIYHDSGPKDYTVYVDIINLSNGEKEKITIAEIKSGNKDKDYKVYYNVVKNNQITIVYKNLKENIEYDDEYKSPYKMTEGSAATLYLNDSEKYYIDNDIVFYENIDKKIKKQLYKCDDDDGSFVGMLSFISKDLVQIGVEKLATGVFYQEYWDIDKVVYYDANSGKIFDGKTWYCNVFMLDEDKDIVIPELIEEKEAKKFSRDADKIEQDFSISQKRILNEDIEDIDEEIICKKIDLSMDDLLEFRDNFIGKKSSKKSYMKKEDEERYLEIAERNYNILKYFISISDDALNDDITISLNEKREDKYNKLNAAILSGIIKYYFDENTYPVRITNSADVYDLELSIGNCYAMTFDFDSYNRPVIFVEVYNDAESIDYVRYNYEKYHGNNNMFLELYISSYEFLVNHMNI